MLDSSRTSQLMIRPLKDARLVDDQIDEQTLADFVQG